MRRAHVRLIAVSFISLVTAGCDPESKRADISLNTETAATDPDKEAIFKEFNRQERLQELIQNLSHDSSELRKAALHELQSSVVRKRDIQILNQEIGQISDLKVKENLEDLIELLTIQWRLPDKGWAASIDECGVAYHERFKSINGYASFRYVYGYMMEPITRLEVVDFSDHAEYRQTVVDLILILEPDALKLSFSWDNISFLKLHTNLQELSLDTGNAISFEPLRELTQLNHLSIANMKTSDIKSLKIPESLKQLRIENSPVVDISQLENFSDLREISLKETKVVDLSPLSKLAELEKLDLTSTPVSDLKPLRGLRELREINLSDTKVSDLSPLKSLPNLEVVHFKDNKYVDLSPFEDASFSIIK